MEVNVSMTGSGSIGEIIPGWTVQENASPAVIGDTSAGAGVVSFSARSTNNSRFIVNNSITSDFGSIGQVTGYVKSNSESGMQVNVTHDTKLSRYDGVRQIPTIIEGSAHSALDMINQLIGIDKRLARTQGKFWSLAGHVCGFDYDGNMTQFKEYISTVKSWDNLGNYIFEDVITNRDSAYSLRFSYLNNKIYADYVYGDSFPMDATTPTNRIAYKTRIAAGAKNYVSLDGYPDSSNLGTGFWVQIGVDRSTGNAYIEGSYRPGGIITSIFEEQSLTGLDLSQELAMFLTVTNNNLVGTLSFVFTLKVCNTSDYTNVKTLTFTMGADRIAYWQRWKITGYARALWTRYDNDAEYIGEWENEPSYVVEQSVIDQDLPTRGAISAEMNMWEYLQDVCSAYHQEIAVVNDVVTVRRMGERTIDVTEYVGNITLTPTTVLGGTSIDVVYTNSQGTTASRSLTSRAEIYDAYDDQNRVLSVKIGETNTTTIDTGHSLLSVLQPQPMVSTTTIPNTTGYYHVCGSDGVPIGAALWEAYGGGIEVSINADNDKAIDVKLIGPRTQIAALGDTYSIAYSSGEKRYAALSIMGTALKITPKTLHLQTGADPVKTAGSTVKTINNPFISKLEQAYDAGIWASLSTSGPKVTISGTIPITSIDGLGLVAGSLVAFRDSIYRIVDATIGNMTINFTAERHVTVGNFDSFWTGRLVELHDSMWAGFDVQDQVIAPFYFIGDTEGIVLMLDTDGNPYYTFVGVDEIAALWDTDMVPYYTLDVNDPNAIPVYLDTDSTPYAED